jgi:hypothetical protein
VPKFFNELFKVYPWIKLALGSLVGILGGSSFITFINKYAIFNYTTSFGGRLPAESVPYIDVAVSILSFAFLTISFVSALLIYGLLTFIAGLIHKKFERIPEPITKVLSGILTSVIISLASGLFSYINKNGSHVLDFITADFFNSSLIVLLLSAVFAALLIWKSLIRWFSLLATLSLILTVTTSLFDAKNYSSFLREIQYGGGVSTTIVYNSEKSTISGALFLTTNSNNIIWDSNNATFVEIPTNSINKMVFHENKKAELPKIKGSIISLFRHLWS